MTASADTSILHWFFGVSRVTNSLLCDCILYVYLHLNDIISVLTWVQYVAYFIIFLHVCLQSFWIYLIFVIFGYLFIGFIDISYISCFPFFAFISFDKIEPKWYTRNASTWMMDHCGILCQCISLYKFHFPSSDFFKVLELTSSIFHDNVDRYTFTW